MFLFSLFCGATLFLNQSPQLPAQRARSISLQNATPANPAVLHEEPVATLRVTTREVLVDVIALQATDQPVLDLKPDDLQVSESFASVDSPNHPLHGASAEIETITSLHVIDPNALQPSADDPQQSGFQIATSCLERSTLHYRLAFHPGADASRSGYHWITIATRRHGIRLFYRHQYYIGLSEPRTTSPGVPGEDIKMALLQAACYHSKTPPSISLQARFVAGEKKDVAHYSVAIDADSLFFVTLERNGNDAGIHRFIALDYGVCNLDSRGLPINFFHAPLDAVLTSADYARALDRGFPHVLEFPASDRIAMTRVAVRDRATGNLGVVEAAYPGTPKEVSLQTASPTAQTAMDLKIVTSWLNLDSMKDDYGHTLNRLNMRPEPESVGSFGSIVPAPRSFCGDVYELPDRPQNLPDFRESDPIASLYTSTLDVPNQIYSDLTRIPGQPPGLNPFGIDYHAIFWIAKAGEYRFLMISDDGAIVRIDDKKVIDLDGLHPAAGATGRIHLDTGRHTIEVPYLENAEGAFALELWVKAPRAREWTLFDINNYAPPSPVTDSSTSFSGPR